MYKQSQDSKEIVPMLNYVASLYPTGRLKSYLEIGSYAGESLEYTMDILERGANVVLVDLGDNREARRHLNDVVNTFSDKYRITLITGDSKSPAVIKEVQSLCPPSGFNLCLIDGCHDFDFVVSDLKNYGPLSTYVALHDIDSRAIQKQVAKHGYEKPCSAHVWSVLKLARDVKEFINPENTEKPKGLGVVRGISIGR